jgi:hypothetical protein
MVGMAMNRNNPDGRINMKDGRRPICTMIIHIQNGDLVRRSCLLLLQQSRGMVQIAIPSKTVMGAMMPNQGQALDVVLHHYFSDHYWQGGHGILTFWSKCVPSIPSRQQ